MNDVPIEPNDIVISSRIRLARNIADFPFISTCSDDQRLEIESVVLKGIANDQVLSDLTLLDSFELNALERQFLMDLQLVSSPLQETTERVSGASETADVGSSESDVSRELPWEELASYSINEEDHLRITVNRSDLNLQAAWRQISAIDDRVESQLTYAFSQQLGYLTACPANVGTGMRVSVLMHLPALVMTGQVEKVMRSLQRLNVVARGEFGDSAVGDFFRVSNQATLGIDEDSLIEQVTAIVPRLIKYEREARRFLVEQNREGLRRDVADSLEKLCRLDLEDEDSESHEHIMQCLSKIRMGVGMGLLEQADADRVNRLFALVQLRDQLVVAIAREDYREASELRDRIATLEKGGWRRDSTDSEMSRDEPQEEGGSQ
ncbi:MAG: ATP--guanido phosphotransferase [Planctomycetaceae bacterium]|nr:ATP--guanido phosphotransferase [Planctomycetaceae bacterium]MCP4773843.1 ATP--guanido phosphotransferase [Planctomycetaceae bacterium]